LDNPLQDYLIVYKRYKNKEINIFGNFTGLLWSIAECYEELGNHFESIQYYNRVIELKKLEKNNPFTEDLSKLYYCRAESKMKLFDYRGAIKDYQFAISVHSNERPMPRLLTLYNSIGRARLLLEDNQNALIDLYKGIKLSKDETITFQDGEETSDQELGESYYLIGNAKFKINNIEGACKAWSKSGELGYADAYNAIKDNCK
jgi:tetratricopeptide (TPR) repeat protein